MISSLVLKRIQITFKLRDNFDLKIILFLNSISFFFFIRKTYRYLFATSFFLVKAANFLKLNTYRLASTFFNERNFLYTKLISLDSEIKKKKSSFRKDLFV